MIHSEVEAIDFGALADIFTVPVYTNDSKIILTYKPDFAIIESGGEIVLVDDEITPDANGRCVFAVSPNMDAIGNYQSDAITFENRNNGDSININTVWSYDASSIKLSEIIDDVMLSVKEGTYYEGATRKDIMLIAKTNLEYLNLMKTGAVERVELELDDTNSLRCPIDMVSPCNVYAVSENGSLLQLFNNKNLNVGAQNFIYDDDGNLLRDSGGYAITGWGLGATPEESRDDIIFDIENNIPIGSRYGTKGGTRSIAGEYLYVKKDKRIYIHNSPYEVFVLFYNSDINVGRAIKKDIGGYRIPRYYAPVLEALIYYKWIERIKSVPRSEVMRAKQEYGVAMTNAEMASMNYNEIVQALNTKNTWLKR